MQREKLIGWLVIYRHQVDAGLTEDFICPKEVREAHIELGWLELRKYLPSHQETGESRFQVEITAAGYAVSDLHAPEWGIDSLPMLEDDAT